MGGCGAASLAVALAFTLRSVTAAAAPPLQVEPPPPPPPAAVAKTVQLRRIGDGLRQPVALTFAPGDPRRRLFIVEKLGVVRAFVRGPDGRLRADGPPLLDVQGRVSSATEEGLLGLAFHPGFAKNHKLYIAYTDHHKDVRYAEFVAPDGNQVDPKSERELLHLKHPFNNHNGGNVVFGPDGKLYLGTGDGGWANDPFGNGQDPTTLLGKMLRLDPDAPGTPHAEMLMRGLRNPWRYAFDRKTGDLYIADVGQDRYEEVDVIPAGTFGARNLGWKIMEGLHCRSGDTCDRRGLTLPVVEYNHQAGCSITGGFVYRGKRLPMLDGAYFYADYCTALIRSFRLQGGRVVDHWDWRAILDPQSLLSGPSSFGEDADGELYLLSLDGSVYAFEPR